MSVFVIAEAGVNHNGSLDLAKKLVGKVMIRMNVFGLKMKLLLKP